jgi:hypothetical protein
VNRWPRAYAPGSWRPCAPRGRHGGGYHQPAVAALQVPSALLNGDANVICRVIEVLQGVISWIKLYYYARAGYNWNEPALLQRAGRSHHRRPRLRPSSHKWRRQLREKFRTQLPQCHCRPLPPGAANWRHGGRHLIGHGNNDGVRPASQQAAATTSSSRTAGAVEWPARCRPDFRSGSEKPLNFWVWLEISRGQDQGPVREITLIITSPERSNRGEREKQCIDRQQAIGGGGGGRE